MSKQTLVTRFIPVVIVVAAIAAAALLVATRPQPARETPVDRGQPVRTQTVEQTEQRFTVHAQGKVIPARQVVVQPQVSGRVVQTSPDLVPGGIVGQGDVLFSIDDTDYRIAVAQAQTRVAEAEAALALEQGRRVVAEQEWALFADQASGTPDPSLVLREPQLQAARAAVDAARAQLRQSRLNLSRTTVTAPFNAVVRAEQVDPGQFVTPQTPAAQLVGTDQFWIQASLPVAELTLVSIEGEVAGSTASVIYDTGTHRVERQGTVIRKLADLDRSGQMARVLIAVDDPLALTGDNSSPLLLESFVDVAIRTETAVAVVTLQPQWLHDGERVYVYRDGVLEIRDVEVAWRDSRRVYVRSGLDHGTPIVTSSIATPVAGMKLDRSDDDRGELSRSVDNAL